MRLLVAHCPLLWLGSGESPNSVVLAEGHALRVLGEVIRHQILLRKLVVRFLKDVRELLRCAEIVGAVADLVGDVGLVAEVCPGLQNVLAVLEGCRVHEQRALRVLCLGRIPPRLPCMRLARPSLILPA